MKTLNTTFVLLFAFCAAITVSAQVQQPLGSANAPDSVLLSEQTDGNYIVRRYLIQNQDNAAYSVRYLINTATLNATLNGNPIELKELNSMIENLLQDSLMQAKTVTITGYSSPDGPLAFNKALAAKRAQDFKNYVDQKYHFSKHFNVKVSSVAEDWQSCRALVEQMPVPDKQYVLNTIDSSVSADQKEMTLKKQPAAWNYMKLHILPPLRRVEITFDYAAANIIEVRTMLPAPAPKPTPAPETKATACDSCCCEVIDTSITGIIVEMPESKHDYRKQMREEEQVEREMDRTAKHIINHDSREAEKIAKEDLKAAKKIAKKEAKAAKKAEKMARKNLKDLEDME